MRKRLCSICALCNNSNASAALLYRRRSRRRNFLDRLDSATPKDLTLAISGGLATDVPDLVRRKDGARCTKSGARLYSSTLDPLCVRVGRRRRPSSFSGASSIDSRVALFGFTGLSVLKGWISCALGRNRWEFRRRKRTVAQMLAPKRRTECLRLRGGRSLTAQQSSQAEPLRQTKCFAVLPY